MIILGTWTLEVGSSGLRVCVSFQDYWTPKSLNDTEMLMREEEAPSWDSRLHLKR